MKRNLICFQRFLLLTHFRFFLVWRWIVLHQQRFRKMLSPGWLLSVCTSQNLRRIYSVTLSSSQERKSAAVWIEPARCAIFNLIATVDCIRSQAVVKWIILSGRTAWLICYLSGHFLAVLFRTGCLQTREMLFWLPKTLSSILTFWFRIFDPNGTGRTFSALTGFFGLGSRQAWVN